VSRSVLRIEQPSTRHRIAWIAASGLDSIVSLVSCACGSQNVDLQELQRQR